MAEIQNRTLICSVLFIDIVEYSRKPVVEQLHLKDRFNDLLTESLREVALKDRVIIDTGDGAACTFTGDPEDALFVAARLQESIAGEADVEMSQLSARMGINLGPVRLVKDINGQPNVIGDGINVSQRIMNFAQPGQVLVSHSYYEAVSRLSDESSNLFTYQGSRTDKHIRDHEVYALCLSAAAEQKRSNEKRRAVSRAAAVIGPAARAAEVWAHVFDVVGRKPRWALSVALVATIVSAAGFHVYDSDLFSGNATAEAAAPTTLALKSADVPMKLVSLDTAPEPAQQAAPSEPVAAQPAPAAQNPDVDAAKPQHAESEAAKAAANPAVLDLAIAPWGTIYVDGKVRGASPPLRELKLKQGKHRVVVKNAGFPDHVVMVEAKSGERIRIKHKFN